MEEQGEERGRATANIHAWNQQIHIKYDFLNNLRIHAEMWQKEPDTHTQTSNTIIRTSIHQNVCDITSKLAVRAVYC